MVFNKRMSKKNIRKIEKCSEMKGKHENELLEIDRIAKMLVRRDFELLKVREKRENELLEIKEKAKELEESKRALKDMLSKVNRTRRTAEDEKNKTLAIITNFTDGLLMFDKEDKISLINPRAENFLGVQAKEVIEKSISDLVKFKNFKALVKVLGKKIKTKLKKELILAPNLILEVSSIFILRKKEKIGTLVILHDVTREKRIERMKTEFVSIAAHQLRTPLSAIKWTLKMFLDGDLGQVTKEQKKFMEKTYRSNERMINLINALLNITRIEEGRYVYIKALFDIKKLCKSIIKSYKEKIKKRKIDFEFIAPKKIPRISMDQEKIESVIRNLFENAIKYTPREGDIKICLRRAKYRNKKEVEISVHDSGVGIPIDQQFRVFTKFFRGANIIRMETEGTGLGLFIAKNIIEAHKGRIWFKSQEGKGSTFCFTLPC